AVSRGGAEAFCPRRRGPAAPFRHAEQGRPPARLRREHRMSVRQRMVAAVAAAGALSAAGLVAAPGAQAQPAVPTSYLSHFHHLRTIASTVPGNGDVNPYGIFVVRR